MSHRPSHDRMFDRGLSILKRLFRPAEAKANSGRRSRRKNVAPGLELLERRLVLSVVSINVVGGDLTITTDNVADNYQLTLTADNTVQVSDAGGIEGTFPGVTGTLTFTGGTAADNVTLDLATFTLAAGVNINTGDGADIVLVTDTGVASLNNTLDVDLGQDGDQFTLQDTSVTGDVTLTTGSGTTTLNLNEVNLGGNVILNGGTGIDRLNINGAILTGSLNADLGSGGGRVEIDNGGAIATTTIGGDIDVTGGTGDDQLYIDRTSVSGGVTFTAGDGNNTLYLEYATSIGGAITMTAGTGDDEVTLDDEVTVTGLASFDLGDGNNDFEINETVTFLSGLTVTTGAGDDDLDVSDTQITGDLTITAGDGANRLYLEDDAGSGGTGVTGNVSITGGVGTDTVRLAQSGEGLTVGGTTTVDTGDGDDSLTMRPLVNGSGFLALDGGAHTVGDTFTLNGSGTLLVTGIVNFETFNGAAGPFDVTVDNVADGNDGAADTYRVVRVGANLHVETNGTQILVLPFASVSSLTIDGSDDDDTLELDFAGGNPIPGALGTLTFQGGAGSDGMRFLNGNVDTVRYFSTNANDGSVEFDDDTTDNGGAAENRVNYTGLSPIFDNLNAANRVFTFNSNAQSITLSDDVAQPGGPFAGMSQIDSPGQAEIVFFNNPTASLTVNAGSSGDTVSLITLDANWAAPTININGSSGIDQIQIAATPANTTVNVDTGSGVPGDLLILGAALGSGGNTPTTFAQFNTGTSVLDFLGANSIISFDDAGGVGELYVDDSGDATADVGTMTSSSITGVSPATINYVGLNSNIVQLALGTGSDTLNVNSTGADDFGGGRTTVFGNDGNDTLVIAADALSGRNTFEGDGGNDTITLNFPAGTTLGQNAVGYSPFAELIINGGDPASDDANRDRVNISLAAADATVRNVGIDYSTTPGTASISGLSALAFTVNTTETVVYTGGTDNDDILNVTGTANGNEILSVTPISANEANVFLGGAPMLTVPPGTANNNNPGVAGGASGPDLSLRGLAQATGLTVNGGGGVDDRIVVNAPTETGTGIGFAGNPAAGLNSTVRAANAAFDNINVNENFVAITNFSAGGVGTALVQANIGAGFGPIPNVATVTVNTGDEAGVRPAAFGAGNGAGLVADDITALLSTQFQFQINGGDPLPPGVAPLTGDRLNVVTPGELNIFSDANNPPNVFITSSIAGVSTRPIVSNNIELTLVTSGNGVVNILGDNNNTAVQNDQFLILGQDVDQTLAGGDLFGDNEFQLVMSGDNTQAVTNRAPIGVRNVLQLNVSSFAGDDQIVIDPSANTTTTWNVVTNVDSGAGNDDLTYGNVITNLFADATPDGSQAFLNEAVVVDATITPGAGSITVPGAVTISFQGTEDLSFYLNDTTPGDTDTLTIRTPDSAGVAETVTVNPDAAGDDANPNVDIDASVGVQLLRIQEFSLIDPNNNEFFGLAINFDLQGGNDTLIATPSANGVAINVNGGNPSMNPGASDTIIVTGTANANDLYIITPGATGDAGAINATINGAARSAISFTNIEGVNINGGGGTGADGVTLQGTDGANTVTLAATGALAGTARVDAGPIITFGNLGSTGSDLNLNGLGGDDTFHITQIANWGIDDVNIDGGAPNASDSVVIVATAAVDAFVYTATGANSGQVDLTTGTTTNYNLTDVEHLLVDGAADIDSLAIATANAVITPGANPGEGTVTPVDGVGTSLLPLAYRNLETVSVTGTTAVIQGTDANDAISVSALGIVTVTNNLGFSSTVDVSGFNALVINSLGGDDSITINGSALFAGGIRVIGGDNGNGSDSLSVIGTAAVDVIDVDLTLNQVTGVVGGPVDVTGIEHLNVDGLGGADVITVTSLGSVTGLLDINIDGNGGDTVDVIGTSGADILNFNPTDATSGQVSRVGTSTAVNYANVTAALTVQGGAGGFDVVNVLGTEGVDNITSTANTVTRDGTVTIGVGIDRLDVTALGGDDVITLTGVTLATVVYAGDGNDTIVGSPQVDSIYGGFGNDILVGGAGNDFLYGEEGNDLFGNLTVTPNGVADDAGADQAFGGEGFDNFVWEPGDGADINNGGGDAADVFRFFGSAAANTFVLRQGGTPTHFNAVVGAVTIDNHGIEDVIVDGQGGGDTFTVEDLYATEVVSVNLVLGAGTDVVTVNGRDVSDNISISNGAVAGSLRLQGLQYNVNLTGSALPDTLTVNGNNGDDTITANPGVEAFSVITLNGGEGHDSLTGNVANLNGNAGNDTLIGGAGNQTMDGGAGDDTFVGNGGTDNVGGGAGSSIGDTILIAGTDGADNFNLTLSATGQLVVAVNGQVTTYGNFLGGPIATSGVEQLLVQGFAGNDSLTVDSANGAIPILINFDGGNNADLLTLTGGVATTATYAVGPNVGEGTSTIVIGGVSQIVRFNSLEPVIDLVAGPLAVVGTNANNAINYSQGSVAANGLVSIDGFETIEFSNKTTLTINALAGSDTININNPNTPTGLTAITINGGDPTGGDPTGSDPTGSDTVVFNGTAGADAVLVAQLTADGAQVTGLGPVLNLATTEHLVYNGQGGGDAVTYETPATADQVTFTPGTVPDQASITARANVFGVGVPLLGLDFVNIGSGGNLTFANNGGGQNDLLELNGTANDDVYNLTAATVQVTGTVLGLPRTVLINTTGIARPELRGLDGDDTFNVPGDHGYIGGVGVEGGNPSASDVLNFIGSGGAVTADLAAAIFIEAGFNPVDHTGIETANLVTQGGDLNILGSVGADVFTVTPTGVNAITGQLTSSNPNIGSSPVINGVNIGTLNVDLLGGNNRLVVNGTQAGETITADTTLVTVGAFETVNYTNTEDLHVVGQAGSDTFNVTPGVGTTIFVDGGDPIGSTPGDQLNLFPPAAFVVESGPENDEGGLRGLNMDRVSWDRIEGISLSGPGAAKIVGTSGDDDITIVARDASTHAGADGVQDFTVSINGGISILFLNQPTLLVDALAGDDDIIVRAPAPNNAAWNVALTIAGGTPAAATGDQGDVLEYETPGQQTITYAPGLIPGTGVLNDTTLGTTITIAQFVCPVDGVLSSQGSIEQLILDGEGGNDSVTVLGTAAADAITVSHSTALDSGAVSVNNLLGLSYEDLGAGATLAINGLGGTDTLIVDGTSNDDVFGVLANGNVTLTGHLTIVRTDYESVTLRGQDGDDVFNINGGATLATVAIEGGNPSASDTVNYVATAGAATTVELGALTITQANPVGAIVALGGIEHVNLTSSGAGSTLTVNGTANNDTIDVSPTAAGAGSFVRTGLGTTPSFNYSGVAGAFTVTGGSGGFDILGILGDDAADTVTSTATTVTVKGGTVTLGASLEYLNINTLGGNDTVTLTGLAIPKTVDGGDGDDFIDLSAAVDALILGGAGNDILIGSPVADLIYGGSGNDILIGGGGIDEEYGEDGNDQFGDLSLAGNGVADDSGADFLFGGDGIDTFIWEPGDGSDVINGGDAGTDVLRFFGDVGANNLILSANAGNPTRFNLNLGAATVDTSGIENVFVIAAAGADTVTVGDLTTTEISALNIDLGVGDADTVIVNGRNTADSLVASSVAAGLVGIQGLGYDINLSTATTADTLTINGNEGDDSIKVNVGVENTIGIVLNGNDGNDFLSADATINGGNGNDTIQGGAGPDFLNGDAGDDTFLFSAGAGIDTIDGGTGFDVYLVAANGQGNVINVSETAVTLDGGTENLALSNLELFQINAGGGNDTVTVSLATIVGNIDAGSGDDIVNGTGSAVSLTISGGDGNDSLTGGAGADLISGGQGNDTLIGGAGVDHEYGDGGNDRFGDASLTGNGVADDPGADFLFGGDGIDQFVWEPGDGSDVVQGGDDAADILRFIGSAEADVLSLGANVGAPTHFNLTLGAATVDTHGVEQVILLAGAGADSISVGDLTTTEIGAVNIDLGAGDADSVTFNGRNTPDNLSVTSPAAGSVGVLGLGYDVNVTNAAVADTLIVNGNEGDDTIKANVGVENTIGIVFNGNDGNDFLSADAVLNGGNGDDTLEGGAGADTINGDAGNDTILFNAGSGVDTIDGGTGFDVFVVTGNGSNNTISVSETAVTVDGGTENLIVNNLELFRIDGLGGNDSINVSVATVPAHIDAGSGDDTVTGTGSAAALFIVGGDGNDTLIGGSANDEIYGGSGNDILIGGAGIDHEYGEAGNDRFGDLSLNGNAVADDAGADFLFGADGVDTFIWEPGDGSDLIQGGDDLGDVLRFLGSAAANAFLLSSSANDPTHFNLNLGAATVDSTGIEQVVVNAQAGADAVTIGDLTTTEVKAVNVDLGAGDADSITVNGRNVSDDIGVSSPAAGSVGVQGLSYTLGITNVAQADTLIVNGNEGDDTIKANVGVENTVTIVFNGNDGDDLLSADATLNGGNGDDILIGGLGADTLNGGDGDDLLTGNGGVDSFDGGAGYDTIVEARNANFTLTDTTLLIGAEGIDTVASMENALLTGGIGTNTFFIGAFTGDTTVTGTGGSDTVDFSTATQGIHIDLDAKNVDQIINLAGRKIVFGDIIENLNASPFDDTINVDIAQFNRLINGGLENAIPPGDRLNVDLLGSNPSSTKVPNGGKLGSFNGTVNGSGFTGTITYQDIETLVIKGANSTPPDFSSATQYDVGDGPRGVITADVNGDGRLDMIVSNSRSNNISVRFGDGFGVFGALVNYSAGGKKAKQTTTVAVGDVDGDGDLDIVVTNRKTNNVSVLLNDGTGAFGTATLYDTGIKQSGKFPTSVKFGDMNNDGNIDIVTANANVRKNGSISILTGDGAGGFGAPNVTQTLGRRPRDLVLIDTNADGNLDVVATNLFSRNVVVLNGNGAGGLTAPVSYDVGVTPNSIISGDFNGDGILDVATTSLVSPRISILIGTGAAAGAAFLPVKDIKYPAVHLDISITTADIDGDGNLDLLLANRNDNTLSYLLGNGNGTFDNPVEFKTGNTLFREPVSIAVGDFNNDGAIDIMIANAGSDDVSVLIHDPIV